MRICTKLDDSRETPGKSALYELSEMTSYVKDYIASLQDQSMLDYKLQLVRGVPQNPTFDEKAFEEVIDNFVTKDGDTFVATYVKAGTTWTQQIIHSLLRQGEEGGKYGESVPWLEACASSPDMVGPREAPGWTMDKINAAPGPRYFKSHATVKDLPRGSAKVKCIIVVRNPKDTVVSLYHHAKSKPEFGYTGSFDDFVSIFLAGKAENGSWFDHVLDWHKSCQADPENHLFLKYEDMYDELAPAVQKIASFLNITVNEEVLAKVVKASSMSEMKVKSSIGLNHLRQGGYGNWRDHFSVRLSELFDDVYKFKMQGSGLTFNFGSSSSGESVVF